MRRWLLPLFALAAVIGLASCHQAPHAPYAGGSVAKLTTIDQTVGTGTQAQAGMVVSVLYTGWLYDKNAKDHHGREFDSTSKHGDQPFRFTLGIGQVIPGWDKGVVGMRVGGVRELLIPASLAYGARGAGDGVIPPNASLVFRIKLVDAKAP
ncbi:MAG TPA: FKBP-type peptidyl-prolyl cis-trans isomerase [Rhodanobacteraceae bacterium]